MLPFYLSFKLERKRFLLIKKAYKSDKISVDDKDDVRKIRRAIRVSGEPYGTDCVLFGKSQTEKDALFFIFRYNTTSTESVEIKDEAIIKEIQGVFDYLFNEDINPTVIKKKFKWKLNKNTKFSMYIEPIIESE